MQKVASWVSLPPKLPRMWAATNAQDPLWDSPREHLFDTNFAKARYLIEKIKKGAEGAETEMWG